MLSMEGGYEKARRRGGPAAACQGRFIALALATYGDGKPLLFDLCVRPLLALVALAGHDRRGAPVSHDLETQVFLRKRQQARPSGGLFHIRPPSKASDMIIVLKPEATPEVAQELLDRIAEKGLKPLHM